MDRDLDKIFGSATPDPINDVIRWLVGNRILRLTDFTTKFGQYIPFDFRIDRCGSGAAMHSVGERMADRFIEIEKDMGIRFDSMLCSLYSGVFGGVSTALWLYQKYDRDIKIAVSRRSYLQIPELERLNVSIHPLKNKSWVGELIGNVLIHDEMTNTGNTVKELINLCQENRIKPKAVMIIADRILDPMPAGSHIRMYDHIPCYSLITHHEIVKWCENNPEIWKTLYEPS